MQKHEAGLKGRLRIVRLARNVLRLFRADAKSPVSSIDQEKFVHVAAPVIIHHDSHREIRSALLNAERRKAEAWQKHRSIH